jgi:hypothetical protein
MPSDTYGLAEVMISLATSDWEVSKALAVTLNRTQGLDVVPSIESQQYRCCERKNYENRFIVGYRTEVWERNP